MLKRISVVFVLCICHSLRGFDVDEWDSNWHPVAGIRERERTSMSTPSTTTSFYPFNECQRRCLNREYWCRVRTRKSRLELAHRKFVFNFVFFPLELQQLCNDDQREGRCRVRCNQRLSRCIIMVCRAAAMNQFIPSGTSSRPKKPWIQSRNLIISVSNRTKKRNIMLEHHP